MDDDQRYFELLKSKIVETLSLRHPTIPKEIDGWKPVTISYLQQDLRDKESDQISERWFYNHMKSSSQSLPRIDILNLLSRYVGYIDWSDFKYQHQEKIAKKIPDHSNRIFIVIPLLLILALAAFFISYKFLSRGEYQFCFVSNDDLSPIQEIVEIEILTEGHLKNMVISDTTGCLELSTDLVQLKFRVRSANHQPDTVILHLDKSKEKYLIKLR